MPIRVPSARGAVVAADVDDQRVVQLAQVVDRQNHAADLVIGVGEIGGVDVGLADEHLLLVGRELVPTLQEIVRPWGEFGVLRDYAEPLLVGEYLVAKIVPALVEQVHVADLLDPLRRRVMRRVRAAGHVIDEERLLRCERVDAIYVGDRFVRHRGGEIPAGLADIGIDRRHVPEEVRLPLAGVAADEAVEILEAHADRPLVEGPVLARLKCRRVVVLAEPGRAITVVLEDPTDGRLVTRNDRIIAGVAGRRLGDHAEADRVMVAPRDECCARRRAKRGRMEVSVAQSHLGDAVQRRRRDHAAECARRAEADVIGHDQEHVGRARGRHHARRPIRLRFRGVALDLAAERLRRRGQLIPVDGDGGAGRARHVFVFLSNCRSRDQHRQSQCGQQYPGLHGTSPLVCAPLTRSVKASKLSRVVRALH